MRINLLARTALAIACTTALVTPALMLATAQAAPAAQTAHADRPAQHARAATPTITAKVTKQGMSLRGIHGLHAGRAKLVVKGTGHNTVSFGSLKAGYTMSDLMKDFRGFNNNDLKAIKRVYANVDALGGLYPGQKGTIAFPHPGRYFALVGGGRTAHSTMFTVGSKRQTKTPHVDGKIVATDGPGWRGSTTLPASGTLMFKNAATTPVLHHVVMQRVAEGTTVDQVMEVLQKDQGPDPDWVLPGSMDTDLLSAHRSMTLDYDLPPGQYVVLCFMPDPSMHGMPHALMGMIEMIHLT
jgi:hypothetical protein